MIFRKKKYFKNLTKNSNDDRKINFLRKEK